MSSHWSLPAPSERHPARRCPASGDSLSAALLQRWLDGDLELKARLMLNTVMEDAFSGMTGCDIDPGQVPGFLGGSIVDHLHIAYGVPGIDERSGEGIRKQLQALRGVHTVTVWLGEQQIDVDYDPDTVTPAVLTDAIEAQGFMPKFVPPHERWPG